jgi:KDO2-lipid IV(A) lauroyltransferase
VFLLFLFFTARIVPRRIGLWVFGVVGWLFYCLPTVEKARTNQNLRLIYGGQWPEKRIRATARTVYVQLAKNIFDAIYLSGCSDKTFASIVQYNDISALEQAYAQGRGLIGMSGHIGCFEMNVYLVAWRGFKCVTIGQRLFDPRVDALTRRMRTGLNITYLHRDGSGRELLRLLQSGWAFGVLIDQDVNLDGVFARFLGIPAYTPSGPMRLAMKYGIPVFAFYTARQPDNTHFVSITGPLELENTGNFERDLVLNIQKVNDILSEAILKHPQQWVWMHRRWRKKPTDEECRDVPNIESYLHG